VRSLLETYRVAFSSSWLADASDTAQSELMACTRERVLKSGERLFSSEEFPNGMYCVIEGSIWVSGTTRDGRESVLDLYGPGDWFGETATLAGTPRMLHDAEAYGPAVVRHLGSFDLEELLSTHPSLGRSLLRLQARRIQILLSALQQHSLPTIEQRLATRLLMLAGKFGVATPQGLKIDLHLPQETLAKLIGSTRQRVNQILRDWETDNLLEHRHGRIFLPDEASFKKLLT
jgi:CRP/FNR family cyclic AMP-dependent transcriptional regulator